MSLENTHTDAVVLSGFSFGATDNWMSAGAQMNMESISQMCTDGTLTSGCSRESSTCFSSFWIPDFRPLFYGWSQSVWWISTLGRSNLRSVLMISGTEDSDTPDHC